MKKQNQSFKSRRNVIKAGIIGLGTAAVASLPLVIPSLKITKKAQQKIIIRTSGGKDHIAYTKILFEPFTKETGIKIEGIRSNVEPIAEIKTMVETGTYAWDMACLGNRAIPILGQNYLEKHRLNDDPTVSTIMPHLLSDYSVGMNVYSIVLAYRTDAFEGREAPKTWKDFWDVKKFPGRRALRKIPFDTIEEALMADGVSPGQVYPCDLDRAFSSLDKIKRHIPVWWQNAPQSEHLPRTGEVDLLPAFSISVLAAIEAGAPVAFSWDQHIYGYDNWTILKGTPNVEACRQFIQFATDPERQAQLIPYGIAPTQPRALEASVLRKNGIEPKYVKLLPTYPDNFKKGMPSDGLYWADKHSSIIERFNKWMLVDS
ncbi:MAG: putative spermidine/putrescine transport system substrate-binding protein [Glomeribacter sp. 1016415]|nr:putative spermidine/putrescine transport system substrate-binding protein [Glomeribacter sp. 1016415]